MGLIKAGIGALVGAQADAMKTAAGNANGAMTGFMGMGMAMNSSNSANPNQLYNMAASQPKETKKENDSWKCVCGNTASGKFCTECGAKRVEKNGWTCGCGNVNLGKFCSECGAKKPAGVPVYRCDKCGWEPEDPKNPPKFCPECGDKFTDGDIV